MASLVLSRLRGGRTITNILPKLTRFPLSTACNACAETFDICAPFEGSSVTSEGMLRERTLPKDTEQVYLRPGMFLLKKFISDEDQIKTINVCRELGLGPGGFYKPRSTSHEMIMDLGMHFDSRSKAYMNKRLVDGAYPPMIPEEFKSMVQGAIDTHVDLADEDGVPSEELLPTMVPDACLVRFIKDKPQKRVLRQNKYESEYTVEIRKSPVISFCIGDSAKFVYGVDHCIEKSKTVVIQSGDAIMWGGPSRLIYHGNSIIHGTAPRFLAEAAHLRRGLLHLTFKEY